MGDNGATAREAPVHNSEYHALHGDGDIFESNQGKNVLSTTSVGGLSTKLRGITRINKVCSPTSKTYKWVMNGHRGCEEKGYDHITHDRIDDFSAFCSMLKGFSNLSGFSDLQDGVGPQCREIGAEEKVSMTVEEKVSMTGRSHASNETTKSPKEAEKVNDEIRDRDRVHINTQDLAKLVLEEDAEREFPSNQQQGWQTKKTNHVEGENYMATLKDKTADYPSPFAQADTVYKADEYWLDGDEAWDRNGILQSTSDYDYDTWFDKRWGVDDVDMTSWTG